MPKSSKRRTVSPDTGVRERFDARISVGHVRRPVLEGETATHNTLSTLLGALGGTGPIRQKLQQERDVREARKARVAVDEGKTLDEVDTPCSVPSATSRTTTRRTTPPTSSGRAPTRLSRRKFSAGRKKQTSHTRTSPATERPSSPAASPTLATAWHWPASTSSSTQT
jgi:hypothetical protein